MPLVLLLVIIDVMLVVHAVRTGRASPWAFIILFAPISGRSPMWLRCWFRTGWEPAGPADAGRSQGAQSRKALSRALRRGRDRRHDREPRGARRRVPGARAVRGGQAPFRGDPRAADGRRAGLHGRQGARAVRPRTGADTVAILDDLRERFPDYQSADAHLLYARALEACGATRRRCGNTGAVRLFRRRGGARALWPAARAARPRRRGQGLADRSPHPAAPRPGACAQGAGRVDHRWPKRSCAPELGAGSSRPA